MHQVVFTGRLLKGADRAKVETELKRLFKATPRQVEWFLRGKAIVVKSTEDQAQAARYRDALTRAGLECELRSDQPATEPMAAPPAAPAAAQRQLPIPGVSVPAPEPKPKPELETKPGPGPEQEAEPEPKPKEAPVLAPSPQRGPGLGPVTQAITAQDRAPAFVARAGADAGTAVPAASPWASSRLRNVARYAFLLLGAVLVGVLVYGVRQQWQDRQSVDIPAAHVERSGRKVTDAGESEVPEADAGTQQPRTTEALIVGRWQCVEAGSGRAVENEFSEDGRYRSLTHGDLDAFQQIDQLDILVEGRYWLEGDQVVLHVQHIPSREFFGSPANADEYLYWRIETLTPDTMVWADLQLREVRESCLRSQSIPPGMG